MKQPKLYYKTGSALDEFAHSQLMFLSVLSRFKAQLQSAGFG